jgi:hypothetical protein
VNFTVLNRELRCVNCFSCRPGRASQEFLGIILALALLAVEVLDYANWSRECYHRRLTMTVHKEVDPPLYPIPGAPSAAAVPLVFYGLRGVG